MEGRTSIVIAHRLSTVEKSDRVLVLESINDNEEKQYYIIDYVRDYSLLWLLVAFLASLKLLLGIL